MLITVWDDAGIRIDRWLAVQDESLSRSAIQKLISDGKVTINGKKVKSSVKVEEGDEIFYELPDLTEPDIVSEDIPLDILYEDEDVILINKPKGMVVHPAAGHYTGTMVNALMYHCRGNLSGINGVMRPGIVHRIDKDTTGVVVACKNDSAHASLSGQIKEHSVTRRYRAVVCGVLPDDEGTVDAPIARHRTDRKKMAVMPDGRRAVTHYRVLKRFRKHTYIECVLETGRTHQIRVHMAYKGYPLLGDEVYGTKDTRYGLTGQTLHAVVLGFVHPRTGSYMEFAAPLPDYFEKLLEKLPQ